MGKLKEEYDKFDTYVKIFKSKYNLNNIEDIIQDCFIRLMKRDVENINIPSFVYKSINNAIINEIIKNKRKKESNYDFQNFDIEDIKNYKTLETEKKYSKIYDIISSNKYLKSYYIDGLKYREISTKYNAPLNTVRSRIRLAKKKIKPIVKDVYYR